MATGKDDKRDNMIQIEKVTVWVHVQDYGFAELHGRPDWSSPAQDQIIDAIREHCEDITLLDYESSDYGLYRVFPEPVPVKE